MLFKTAALKSATNARVFHSQRAKAALARFVTNEEHSSSDWLRVALFLSEISRSTACLALYGKQGG